MANSGDKITSWSDLYDAVNRVIELPATGSATAFTGTTVLDNANVAVNDTIDDDDLNDLIDRLNVLHSDSLYGSATQLDTNHASTTVNLYSNIPSSTTSQSMLQGLIDDNIRSVINNLNNIQCRNIVSCYQQLSNYCDNLSYYCSADCSNRSTHYSGCNQHSYSCSRCNDSYYKPCTNGYSSRTGNCSKGTCSNGYKISCSGKTCAGLNGCYVRHSTYTVCSNGTCYNGYYTYYVSCSNGTTYAGCNQCSDYYCSANCTNRETYYSGCNQHSYTSVGCNETTYYYSTDAKHNDIQCVNTSWSGS